MRCDPNLSKKLLRVSILVQIQKRNDVEFIHLASIHLPFQSIPSYKIFSARRFSASTSFELIRILEGRDHHLMILVEGHPLTIAEKGKENETTLASSVDMLVK